MNRLAIGLLCATFLSGCATIIEGDNQDIQLQAASESSGNCVLQDEEGKQYQATVPGKVHVKKGDGPLLVTCQLESESGTQQVSESIEPWVFGNILLGGIIGIAVDGITGAWQKYPEDVTLNLIPAVTLEQAQADAYVPPVTVQEPAAPLSPRIINRVQGYSPPPYSTGSEQPAYESAATPSPEAPQPETYAPAAMTVQEPQTFVPPASLPAVPAGKQSVPGYSSVYR